MGSVVLTLDARRFAWSLAVEPWAAFAEVPASTLVRLEVFDFEEISASELEVSFDTAGLVIGTQSPVFSIAIGDQVERHDYSYMLRPNED